MIMLPCSGKDGSEGGGGNNIYEETMHNSTREVSTHTLHQKNKHYYIYSPMRCRSDDLDNLMDANVLRDTK